MTKLLREATEQEQREKAELLKGVPDSDLEEIIMEPFPPSFLRAELWPFDESKKGKLRPFFNGNESESRKLCPFSPGDISESTKLCCFFDDGLSMLCPDAKQTLPRMPTKAYRYVAGRLVPPVPNVLPPPIPVVPQVHGDELNKGKLWPFLYGDESNKFPAMPTTAHRYFAGQLLPPVPSVPPPLVPSNCTLPTREVEKCVRFRLDDAQMETHCSADGMYYLGSDGISRRRRFPVPDGKEKKNHSGARYLGRG